MPFDLPFDYGLGLLAWIAGGAMSLVGFLALRRRWGRRAPQRVKWANVGLSLWMFLSALTFVELYYAIVYDQSDSFNLSNVSRHWFERHVHRNEARMRDSRPFPKRVTDGARRICFAGDSFTFGHGVKEVGDRFSDRVGARLDAVRPGKFVVANIAEVGFDLRSVKEAVKRIVDHGFQVDVVVYTICLNDIETYEPRISGQNERRTLHAPQFFLFRETYFLNLLYFRVEQARLPEVRNYYSQLADSYCSEPWQAMRRELKEFREYCQEHGIDLRLAIFPFLHNLDGDYPFDAAHERIKEFCREAKVPCLDLNPVLSPHAREGLTVNRFDAHPNERAHALAAVAMEQELLDDLFARPP